MILSFDEIGPKKITVPAGVPTDAWESNKLEKFVDTVIAHKEDTPWKPAHGKSEEVWEKIVVDLKKSKLFAETELRWMNAKERFEGFISRRRKGKVLRKGQPESDVEKKIDKIVEELDQMKAVKQAQRERASLLKSLKSGQKVESLETPETTSSSVSVVAPKAVKTKSAVASRAPSPAPAPGPAPAPAPAPGRQSACSVAQTLTLTPLPQHQHQHHLPKAPQLLLVSVSLVQPRLSDRQHPMGGQCPQSMPALIIQTTPQRRQPASPWT